MIIERFVANDLPNLIDKLSGQIIIIGPYRIDLSQFTDLGQVGNQVITALQSLIGRAGTLAGTLATRLPAPLVGASSSWSSHTLFWQMPVKYLALSIILTFQDIHMIFRR